MRAVSSGDIRNPKTEARRKAEGPKSEGAKAEAATSNIQHPTSNIQYPIVSNQEITGRRTFGMRWQEFPGFIGIGPSAQVWGLRRTEAKSEVRSPEARKKAEGAKSEGAVGWNMAQDKRKAGLAGRP
jgi:hypothetical protein